MTTNSNFDSDLAVDLAEFASSLKAEGLSSEVVEAVKTNIFDTLACALAGSTAPAVSDLKELVEEWGGAKQADLWVFGGKYPAQQAAWVNSGMSHARDYDDTHDAAILHAGVSTVPAAIAAAQLSKNCTGADLIAAVAAGLEVTCRLGVAIEVDIVASGFIYSSLLGYFGATAAAGRALHLTPNEMHNAFGIVFSSAAGNHQVSRDASLMKRFQPALAAQAALVAVQLAKRGLRGVQNVFQGLDGFFRIYLQNKARPDVVHKGLGQRFELLNLSYKPFPCCRDTHSAVGAVLRARAKGFRPAEEIDSITVGVTGPGYQMVCTPEAVRAAPKTIVEAQFSIPYAVSAAWIDGSLGMKHFLANNVTRGDVHALAGRVRPYVHEEIHQTWHRFVTPAAVSIRFKDGTTLDVQEDYALGHPNNPMSKEDFTNKALDCASYSATKLSKDVVKTLRMAVQALPSQPSVDGLLASLRPVF
ncbi:2-methylcitrate dehydratase PrpD [Meredithblackwellia eburnea MCA 4105]